MTKFEQFENQRPVSKTLRFKACPVGKTEENLAIYRMVENDAERAEIYKRVKNYIDRYNISFIQETLICVPEKAAVSQETKSQYEDAPKLAECMEKYILLSLSKGKSDKEKEMLKKMEEEMRKYIAGFFSKSPKYKDLFGKKIIEDILPDYLTDEDEVKDVAFFKSFSTAFNGFFDNRKNIYTSDAISTAIPYRMVNQNLQLFISNINVFERIKNALGQVNIDEACAKLGLEPYTAGEIFSKSFAINILPQSGIDMYNTFVGGITRENGEKIKGINELINLFNQQHAKNERLPFLKPLYKQILSDRNSLSFIEDNFENDQELLSAIKEMMDISSEISLATNKLMKIFSDISEFDPKGIYITSGLALTNLSNECFGNWAAVQNGWNSIYDNNNMKKNPKNYEKYEETRRKVYKKIDSLSLDDFSNYGNMYIRFSSGEDVDVKKAISDRVKNLYETIESSKKKLQTGMEVDNGHALAKDEKKKTLIKDYLDSLKIFEKTMEYFKGKGLEEGRDELFYGEFLPALSSLETLDSLYNKVRNYVTKKPYSTDKYKLYFGSPQFLGGWQSSKEKDYISFLLREGNNYFLAVINRSCKGATLLFDAPEDDDDIIEKMFYAQMGSPVKDLPNLMVINGKTERKTGRKDENGENKVLEELKERYLPEEINRIRKQKTYSGENFIRKDCEKYIEYYSERVKDYNPDFGFEFKPASEYKNWLEFTDDVNRQAYSVRFNKISKKQIYKYVDEGRIFLFKIYNKDFSEKSHGVENLHTMYFKALFSEKNLESPKFKLCGEAEMFFRKASIKKEDLIIHKAGLPINNKNIDNEKKTSTFEYDITKDKRYSVDQYQLHISIMINMDADSDEKINLKVRQLLKNDNNPYIIGIDRGERNLLYICVIDKNGKIVEQTSLNEIVNESSGKIYSTDYHGLLDKREKERIQERQSWTAIEGIKELKEGYISQVIHKICELIFKYDAVIALEDLNFGFKNGRGKFEKAVYQKFEKKLIDKLNYLADKRREVGMTGSITRGYQLTEKFESFEKMGKQNGIIFYIPAWLTSKIDPVTGFVDLLRPKYSSIESTREFIMRFDSIRYDRKEDMFAFELDYSAFPGGDVSKRRKWTVWTNGERIRTYRNEEKNNSFDSEYVMLTSEFKKLFIEYGIDISMDDLRKAMCSINESGFYKSFIGLLKLTLQMRNSISGQTDVDFLISPVMGSDGIFYDSREHEGKNDGFPENADANGAYNIARKVLWAIKLFRNTDDDKLAKAGIAISNAQWLEMVQSEE